MKWLITRINKIQIWYLNRRIQKDIERIDKKIKYSNQEKTIFNPENSDG